MSSNVPNTLIKPKTAPSMAKDSEDVGSTIKFIP
jgi:hypothetical protein